MCTHTSGLLVQLLRVSVASFSFSLTGADKKVNRGEVASAPVGKPTLRALGACPKIQRGRTKVVNLLLGNTELAA